MTASSDTPDNGCREATLDELCASTLRHYEYVSGKAHEWNNQVPQAIKAWYEQKKRAAQQPAADHSQLMRFYGVESVSDLIEAQANHIERLQKKLPRIPDQFPRTPREG